MITNSTFSKRCSKMEGVHFLVSIAFKCTPVCIVWSFNILYSVFHLSINKNACINFINIWSLTNSTSEEFTHIWWVSWNGIYRYVKKVQRNANELNYLSVMFLLLSLFSLLKVSDSQTLSSTHWLLSDVLVVSGGWLWLGYHGDIFAAMETVTSLFCCPLILTCMQSSLC